MVADARQRTRRNRIGHPVRAGAGFKQFEGQYSPDFPTLGDAVLGVELQRHVAGVAEYGPLGAGGTKYGVVIQPRIAQLKKPFAVASDPGTARHRQRRQAKQNECSQQKSAHSRRGFREWVGQNQFASLSFENEPVGVRFFDVARPVFVPQRPHRLMAIDANPVKGRDWASPTGRPRLKSVATKVRLVLYRGVSDAEMGR